jgi:hypothetical protein
MRQAMLAAFETPFADAQLNADQPVPQGITAHNAAVPTRRFAVYRNNVVVGLVKALRYRFPVVEKIVGEEFFAAMARVFVIEQPPRSALLTTYGDEFAAFIAAFEPARELPYLADVARLEAARTQAYHAADAAPVDANFDLTGNVAGLIGSGLVSALALLFMTAVIEILIYPGAWPTHGLWATCFLVVIARGPGWLSLDHLIAIKFR